MQIIGLPIVRSHADVCSTALAEIYNNQSLNMPQSIEPFYIRGLDGQQLIGEENVGMNMS